MRPVILVLGGIFVFVTVAAIMVQIMPSPHKDSDYLVIGSIATFVALLVMFGVLVATRAITPNPFFKKRKKKLED